MSLPSRERGLKLSSDGSMKQAKGVAPFAGAWIEIFLNNERMVDFMSLPSRERGLKFNFCGWLRRCVPVAPFAGAWIEMELMIVHHTVSLVAPFAGAWIEIVRPPPHPFLANSRSLRGSVD